MSAPSFNPTPIFQSPVDCAPLTLEQITDGRYLCTLTKLKCILRYSE